MLAAFGPQAGRAGPARFVRNLLGAEPDKWQEDVLEAYGGNDRRIAVKSCHGPGKTTVASWCIIHQMLCRYPQKTVATAPSAPQLQGVLLPEVKKWVGRLPQTIQDTLDIRTDAIYLKKNPAESHFEARTARADAPESIQGIHCDDGYVLFIGDEASGIPENVYESVFGSMSGKYVTTLLIGNPVRPQGYFHKCFHQASSLWTTFTVSYKDSDRVTDDFVRQAKLTYGSESNAFRVRCLGEFPESEGDTVIPYNWIVAAQQRKIDMPDDEPEVWGVDIARYGKDFTCIVGRTRRHVTFLDRWGRTDLMSTAGKIKNRYDEAKQKNRAPRAVYVDVIGMGGGVVDRLKEWQIPVRGINVAENATLSEDYHRTRDELWFRAREWLEDPGCVLPSPDPKNDPEFDPAYALAEDLTGPTFRYRSNGTIEVEAKDDTRSRLHRSPDMGDAMCLTFAGDVSILNYGSKGGFSWDQPLKRNLPSV